MSVVTKTGVGKRVGVAVGVRVVGTADGTGVGLCDGSPEGRPVGKDEGIPVGLRLELEELDREGIPVCMMVGMPVGSKF
jgi:hypothetical protein